MCDASKTGDPAESGAANRVAVFDHLTGPSRGTVSWILDASIDIAVDPAHRVHVARRTVDAPPPGAVARLTRTGDAYEIEALEGRSIWVNGAPTRQRRLEDGDIVEFDETGPISRFRVFDERHPIDHSVTSIMQDAAAYLATSRQPLRRRLMRAAFDLTRRLVFEMTTLFRITITIAVLALAVVLYRQHLVDLSLRESVERGAAELETVSAALSRAQEEALRPADLAALREEFGRRVSSNIERLEMLEAEGDASARVIAGAIRSVALLQVSYGMREKASGRFMRIVVSEAGYPIIGPTGQPVVSLDGAGPIAEIQTIGSGFIVRGAGLLITNRHVALPWEGDINLAAVTAAGFEPTVLKRVAYYPSEPVGTPVEVAGTSERSDLALVAPGRALAPERGLALATALPAAGETIIVMGYPTGLRAMLAQSGRAFIETLEAAGETDFWSVAERLAEAGLVAPLASEGIVAHAGPAAVVYDAETTHGGSGGPVLNMKGEVVAVTAAVLPEFGGANLAVPAAMAQDLLDARATR